MAPTLTFKAKNQGEDLSVAVLSCADLPDMDGAGNKSDPYVKVRVGGADSKGWVATKVADSQDPSFDLKSSTFFFPMEGGDSNGTEVFFEVWDKDTFTDDDFMGKASAIITRNNLVTPGMTATVPLVK